MELWPGGSRGGEGGSRGIFREGKGTSPTEDSPVAQNIIMIH